MNRYKFASNPYWWIFLIPQQCYLAAPLLWDLNSHELIAADKTSITTFSHIDCVNRV